MSNLALYAISAALLAGGPSDPARDDLAAQPRDESAATAPAQAPADEAQPAGAPSEDSSGVTHPRAAVHPRRAPLRGDRPAADEGSAGTSRGTDAAPTSDPALNDGYFSQQEIWTAP
ncbi:MAG TPA: hypothetical protein VF805_11765 [Anaeromyxobacteraceae bacterium]